MNLRLTSFSDQSRYNELLIGIHGNGMTSFKVG